MKTRNGKMKVRALALAVQGVLVAMYAMPAHADDEQAAALKLPTNFVEIGALNVSRDSAKFGEYTGLNKSGGYLNGNFRHPRRRRVRRWQRHEALGVNGQRSWPDFPQPWRNDERSGPVELRYQL